jgi:hypothetical protein
LLCVIQVFFGGGSVCPGAVLIYPKSGWGSSARHVELTCLFCQMSHRQLWRWRQRQPPNFLSVTCCGEAFPRVGVQGVRGLILVGALFLLDGIYCNFLMNEFVDLLINLLILSGSMSSISTYYLSIYLSTYHRSIKQELRFLTSTVPSVLGTKEECLMQRRDSKIFFELRIVKFYLNCMHQSNLA